MIHFIFDQDGTLFDTEFSVSEITANIAARNEVPVTAIDVFVNCSGFSSRDKFTWAAKQNNRKLSEEQISDMRAEHGALKDALYDKDVIPVIEGVVPCLTFLRDEGCLLSVGSSNPVRRIKAGLGHTGLQHYFNDRIYGPDLVGELKKPDPAVFNLAMSENGSDASNTYIVEDSLAGILAGKAAGAFVVAYMQQIFEQAGYGKQVEKSFKDAGADLVVSDYGNLCQKLKEELFSNTPK